MLLDAHTADEQLDPAAPLAMLLDHFDLIVQTPADVDKLDAAILQLALKGELSPQDQDYEDAGILLAEIDSERQRLVESGTLARVRPRNYEERQVPYPLPSKWIWCTVSDLVQIRSGYSLGVEKEKEVGDIPYLKVGDMNLPGNEHVITTSSRFVAYEADIERYLIPRNSIIFPKRGGAIATNKKRMVVEQILVDSNTMALICFFPQILEYLSIWFQSVDLWALNSGTSVPQINNKDIEPLLIPLPPLAEQKRIVARVDELRRHTAALRAELAAAAQDAVTVNNAALNRLHTAEHADTFAAAWQTLGDAFDPLYSVPQNLTALRQTILQLAVQGKLLAQDPSDEPASALVQWVMSEKLRLQKEGVTAEIEHGRRVQPSEALFPLPLGWTWQRLVDVSLVEMGQSPPGDSYNEVGEGVPLVNGPVEFSAGPFGLTVKTKFTTKPTKVCQEGDLLVCVRGSTTGRTNVAAFDACIGRGVAAVRALVDRKFLNYVILSKRQEIYDAGKGSTFPSISKRQLQDIVIGIPPLAEQERIVAKVDELLALCDVLEAELAEAEAVRVRLVDAILAGV